MGITFSWLVENQLALATLDGRVTVDDLTIGNQTMTARMEESDASMVHLIFDATRMKGVSVSISQSLATLKYLNHTRMGGFLVFGVPPEYRRIVIFLGTVITQVTRARFRTGETLEECLEFLKMLDSTLPDLQEIKEKV